MLAKRIIPCLDIKDGRTVKGVRFKGLRDAGDPVELARRYADEGADELVFLDITATREKRDTLVDLVRRIALELDIPFTVGGGIRTTEQISGLLRAGADKISLNSAIVRDPAFINRAAEAFGSQCIVGAVDAKRKGDSWEVYIAGGSVATGRDALRWMEEAEKRGVGEILLTSMDRDGTGEGFDLELLRAANEALGIPVIASGGAGSLAHCAKALREGGADAVLAASIFHFGEITIPELKTYLSAEEIPVRPAQKNNST